MSTEGSKQMLTLIKELSVFKAMDEDYKAGPKGRADIQAHEERERRRQEIRQEMQALAAESKGDPSWMITVDQTPPTVFKDNRIGSG
jgi:hypothetical protein